MDHLAGGGKKGEEELRRLEAETLASAGWSDRYRDSGALTREDSYFDHCARRGWRTELDERVAEAIARGERVEGLRAAGTGAPRNELEERALSGGSGAGGGFTVPEPVRAQVIDFARARSVAIRAGARVVPIESDTVYFPRVVADPDFGWYAENVQSTDVPPTAGGRRCPRPTAASSGAASSCSRTPWRRAASSPT